MRLLFALVAVLACAAYSGTAQSPTPTPSPAVSPAPTLPMPTPKPPAIPEVSDLRIRLAISQANEAKSKYDAAIAQATAIVRAEIATFEKDHPGWTIDPGTITAVPKPKAK